MRSSSPFFVATILIALASAGDATLVNFLNAEDAAGAPQAAEVNKKDAAKPALAELLATFNGEFVAITPGQGKFPKSYVMGTERGPAWEGPAHEVTFAYSFHMARYEVPQNLYEAVMGSNPSKWKGPRNSAENFSFAEANVFCEKITALMRDAKLIGEREIIRLPSEAEWEYCCRSGTRTPYSFGECATVPEDVEHAASILSKYAWHTGNAAGNDPAVGVLKPNAWGLYDVHGYLWEFVSDAWHESYMGAPVDGSSWNSDDKQLRRVIRGGSWRERYECHRCAYRNPIDASTKNDSIGLRCVKAASTP